MKDGRLQALDMGVTLELQFIGLMTSASPCMNESSMDNKGSVLQADAQLSST